jgi:hypothetical protein
LKPDPVNPRLHSKKQIRQIANSIREFGFNTPVLIDRDGNVMCGHGRLLACRELGMTEVPTVRLDHLTPAQARAFMIADNRLTEIATWDDRLLAEQLRDLTLLGLGPQADGRILLEQERLMAVVVGVTEHLSPCVGAWRKTVSAKMIVPKISNRKLIVPEDPQAKPRESLPSYGRHVPLGSADGTDLPRCVSRFGVSYLRGHIRLLSSTSFAKLPFFPSRSPQRDPRPRGTESLNPASSTGESRKPDHPKRSFPAYRRSVAV